MLSEAAKIICKKSLKKKKPVTVDIINNIYEKLNGKNCCPLELTTILMIVLGFSGFLKYSEIAKSKEM